MHLLTAITAQRHRSASVNIIPDPELLTDTGVWTLARAGSSLAVAAGRLEITKSGATNGARINLAGLIGVGNYRFRCRCGHLVGSGGSFNFRLVSVGDLTGTNILPGFTSTAESAVDGTFYNDSADNVWFGFLYVWGAATKVYLTDPILEKID
jgi:hypothetical protein